MPAEPADPRVAAVAAALLPLELPPFVQDHRLSTAERAVAALDAYDREHPGQVPWLAYDGDEWGMEPDETYEIYRVRSDG